MKQLLAKLAAIGFKKAEETDALASDTAYPIRIKLNQAKPEHSAIDYGAEIKVHHAGGSNFVKPENMVVLECVIRLLRKGYPASCIELEKSWKLGHKGKGRLDILVRHKKNAFAMVECKTWGGEYLKERDNILEDGGQLFSYLIQEATSKSIVLYASKIEAGGSTFVAESVDTSGLAGGNTEERHRAWDKSFIRDGIFNKSAAAYLSKKRNLKKMDLVDLDRESGRGLFNSFAEILRRHTVSDKSNAFNKIFNLFVCKIYDEDQKRPEDELEFQWKAEDSFDSLIDRMGKLYMRGLKEYLAIDITAEYFSSNAEFSFVDVFNKESFEENFSIVREVVELLQGYQIKYTSKHQFLGDFFEKLLNTGIKQEAGQFFTPIPLARFFLKSLPIENIIEENIRAKRPDVIPFVLDYACGSGHFLTEAIDEIEEHIAGIDSARLVGRIQKKFLANRENFYWAKDYIYGIEKDYRLAKTTKIALFLNGDGDAIIVNGDGLDDFYLSTTYAGLLKTKQADRQNEQFDVIVSNPPFSINGFKQYLKNGEDNFAHYPLLTPRSTEIECLFLERLSHLLKEKACAGIILPLSILGSDVGIYVAARKKLLIDFELVGLVELRDKTFSATNTTTVGVFLRKRSRKQLADALAVIRGHVAGKKINASVAAAIAVNKEHYSNADSTAYFHKNPSAADSAIEAASLPHAVALLLIHLLNKDKNTVVAYSGEKKDQEDFLGYRFSSSRGKEGIEVLSEKGLLKSALYDPANPLNPEKVNAHIKMNFVGKQLRIPEGLKNRVQYVSTLKLVEPETFNVKNPSGFFQSEHLDVSSNSRFGDLIDDVAQKKVKLSQLFEAKKLIMKDGLIYNKTTDEVPRKTKIRVLTASNLDIRTGRLDLSAKLIYLRDDYVLPEDLKPRKGDIIISKASGSLKHLGKCVYVEEDIDAAVGGFLSILRPENEMLGKALFYRLLSSKFRQFVGSLRDQNINNMSGPDLASFPMTLPSDLNGFLQIMLEKERQLGAIELKMHELKRKA